MLIFFVFSQEKNQQSPIKMGSVNFTKCNKTPPVASYLVLTSSPQRSFFLMVSKKCEFSGTAILKSKSFLLMMSF